MGGRSCTFITSSCHQRRPFLSPLRAKTVFVKILRCRDRQEMPVPVFPRFSERQHERHQVLLFLGGQLGAQDQIEKLD